MKAIRTILYAAFAAAALGGGTHEVHAQFTMNSIGLDADPTVAIPVMPGQIDAYVLNESHSRVLRRQRWHAQNNVDFKVSLTGMVTQFNRAWTTNNQNSVSSELAAYYYHIYSRDKYIATFKFDGIYGMNFIDDAWFKNQDKLELYHLSSWKMRDRGALKNWAYGLSAKFQSQFAEGYESRTARDKRWSNFMAPGTLTVGVGFTYTSPNRRLPFVVTVNPVSSDALFVLDDGISDARKEKLGIKVPRDAEGHVLKYKDYKIEGGSSVNVDFNRTFALGEGRKVTLQYITTLSSFYGWMTQVARHDNVVSTAPALPEIMPTVGWTNKFILTPLKFLSMEFRTTTIYDRSQVDKVQMQYYLRVGLTYRYKNR